MDAGTLTAMLGFPTLHRNTGKGLTLMTKFKIGDRVALPQVGVGCVVNISTNTAFGPEREFYEIRPDRQSSTIYIPTDLDPGERGLRRVMTAKQARQVIEVLATGTPPLTDQEWRKTLKERLKSADVDEQAALIRDLATRGQHRRLSAQEKSYLEKAQEALMSELVEALHQTPEEVKAAMEKALIVGIDVPKATAPST